MGWLLAAAAVIGLGGSIAASGQQRRAFNEAQRAGLGVTDRMFQGANRASDAELDTLMERRDVVAGGFQRAKGELASQGGTAMREIGQRSDRAQADVSADLTSRGMSARAGSMARAGIESQAAQSITATREGLGSLFASLETRGALADAQLLGDIAQSYGMRWLREAGIHELELGLVTGASLEHLGGSSRAGTINVLNGLGGFASDFLGGIEGGIASSGGGGGGGGGGGNLVI